MPETFVAELLISIILTVLLYLLVPTIIVLTRKKFRLKTLIWITILNGVVVFLTFSVLRGLAGDPSTGNTVPAFIWSGIAFLILKKNSLIRDVSADDGEGENAENEEEDEEDVNYLIECVSCGYRGMFETACPQCGKYKKRYVYLNQEEPPSEENNSAEIK